MATQPALVLLFVAVLLAGAATVARGFYLPGVAPADFRKVRTYTSRRFSFPARVSWPRWRGFSTPAIDPSRVCSRGL